VSSEARHRLSVAVEVGEPARAALTQAVEPLVAAYPGLRWAEPELWYIEVCTLGAVHGDRVPDVEAIVRSAAGNSAQMALRLDGGAGIVDGSALFAGVCHSDALVHLREELISGFEAAALPVQRGDFLPHCVLGRAPGGTRLPPAMARSFRGPMVTWTARRLLVVRTRLRLGGVAREVRSAHAFGLPVAVLP
jgi:RNA 2',3'-cyclic 3'-phosphodiesterase